MICYTPLQIHTLHSTSSDVAEGGGERVSDTGYLGQFTFLSPLAAYLHVSRDFTKIILTSRNVSQGQQHLPAKINNSISPESERQTKRSSQHMFN